MSIRGLQPDTVAIPLASGLQQKFDTRALEAPGLARCIDVQFDELGGIQTRKPYASKGLAIFGGGSIAAADVRRIITNGNELLLFAKDALYSWNEIAQAWVLKGTYLAPALEEAARFTTTGDQVDSDRAELNGCVVVTWHEVRSGNSYGYAAAYDSATGAVTMPPTELAGFQRIRLVALSTKILLSFYDGLTGFYVYALDPASPATALAGASTTIIASNGVYYDVVKVPGQDLAFYACTRSGGGSYQMVTFTSALVTTTASKSAACVAIAVSAAPNGTHVQIVRRSSSTSIHGDYIAISGLSTVNDNTAIATTTTDPTYIACAHRSVTNGGQYRCYVYWNEGAGPSIGALSSGGGITSPWSGSHTYGQHVYSNWIDTGATIGTAALFVALADINSRAFDHNGYVFVWLGFSLDASVLTLDKSVSLFKSKQYAPQNSYFLFRDDALLCAKSTMASAGGKPSRTGWLPGVQSLGSNAYAWAGTKRRAINFVGDDNRRRNDFAQRAPNEITVTFDSDEARRCVRMGNTLYIAGAEILQYDGVQLAEVGFHVLPYVDEATEAGGALATGVYAWKWGARWDNAGGDVDRGSTPSIMTYGVPAAKNALLYTYPLTITHKTDRPIALELWRTQITPTADSSFFRATSKDPGDVALSSNRYVENDTTAAALVQVSDEYTDSTLKAGEQYQGNGGVVESLAPPAATIIAASADRLFLAGVAGEPDRIWYSKLRRDGEVAAFFDGNTVAVPRNAGAIIALSFINETLIAFCEAGIYAIVGDGYDNVGGGANYAAREIPSDVGAESAEAVARMGKDGIIFKSAKGWHLLDRGWGVEYIGGPVSDYDAEEVQAIHVVDTQHQVRILTDSRLLVLDYLVKQWGEWTLASGVSATMWRGAHLYASSAEGVLQQRTDFTGVAYGMDIETAWIPMGQVQGFGRVWKVMLLGEYRSDHKVRVRLARNYTADGTYFQDKIWTPSPTTVGGPLQVNHGPSIQEMQALKIRITAIDTFVSEGGDPDNPTIITPDGEALKLTSLALELGLERGLNRLPAAQRQ